MTLLCMHKGFSCLNKKIDDCDIIIMTSLSHCIHKLTVAYEPWGSVAVWVLEGKATASLSLLSWCLSWSGTIKHTRKCSLFVYLRCVCTRFAWMP